MGKSKIYTKTGDKGTTSLVGGVRVSKTHARLEAYGMVDELNSFLGMLAVSVDDVETEVQLRNIQHRLFALGAYLATDQNETDLHVTGMVAPEHVAFLERAIDDIDASLPPLQGFILPGGSRDAALCHVCRTVCRRAERRILELEEKGVCEIDGNVKRFINRLSDYLFILARRLNCLTNKDEIYWDKSCK